MTTAKLVDCCDWDCFYGILTVANADEDEVQNKIYEIKNGFYKKGFYDWTIEDVLNELPDEWEWDYETDISIIEI